VKRNFAPAGRGVCGKRIVGTRVHKLLYYQSSDVDCDARPQRVEYDQNASYAPKPQRAAHSKRGKDSRHRKSPHCGRGATGEEAAARNRNCCRRERGEYHLQPNNVQSRCAKIDGVVVVVEHLITSRSDAGES